MINKSEDSSDYILTVVGVGAGIVVAMITAVVIFSGMFHKIYIYVIHLINTYIIPKKYMP